MALTTLEVKNYASIAASFAGEEPHDHDSAVMLFQDEVRARYIAADDGDFDAYLAEAFEIFECEWNATMAGNE